MEIDKVTDLIIKAAYEVHNELGVGFVEKVFENALTIALKNLGLDAQQQVPLKVYFRNQVVGEYYADIIVKECVILELKAVKALQPEHQAQLINYLSATKLETGLLINFGKKGLEIKRSFYRSS